jgi:hypothetical protein
VPGEIARAGLLRVRGYIPAPAGKPVRSHKSAFAQNSTAQAAAR